MRWISLVALLAALSAAGCVGEAHVETFDGPGLPTGWAAHKGQWTVVNTNQGPLVEARGDGTAGLSSLVYEAGKPAKNVEVEVGFAILSGADPQGVGVVFNWRDEANYVIVRYSTHEHGWHLFTVIDGERTKREEASVADGTDPGFSKWIQFRVTQEAGKIEAFDGATKVIDYTLDGGASRHGHVGLFVRGASHAYFDDAIVKLS